MRTLTGALQIAGAEVKYSAVFHDEKVTNNFAVSNCLISSVGDSYKEIALCKREEEETTSQEAQNGTELPYASAHEARERAERIAQQCAETEMKETPERVQAQKLRKERERIMEARICSEPCLHFMLVKRKRKSK